MALKPCRECGASINLEAQTCPHCGAPHPTKDKSAAPDPTNTPDPTNVSAAPDPTKDKSSWVMIPGVSPRVSAGVIFVLAVLAIIVGWSLPSAPPVPPPVPPIPDKEENLADKYANMGELQLINSLPQNYKTTLISLEQGNLRSGAISIKTRAEAVAPQDPKLLAIIDAIIKKEEHTGPYLYSQGNGYLANKQYDLAIQKFDEAISLGDTKSYDSRGMAWLAKHEYERAIADFTQAAKFEHENYFIYIHRAEANEQKDDRDSAIADYHRALALAPDKTFSNRINAALKRLTPPLQPEVAAPPPGRRAR
jgi:hypothetical protein